MIAKEPMLNEKKCAWCGKKFIAAPMHSWKHNTKLFCKYTCMLRYRENLQSKKDKK